MKLPGILIDKLVDSELTARRTGAPIHAYIQRPTHQDGKYWPIIKGYRRIGACIRVLLDRGVVVYYKEDE